MGSGLAGLRHPHAADLGNVGLDEIDRVENGQPVGRLLHRWEESDDRFKAVEAPRSLGAGAAEMVARVAKVKAMVESGRTGAADVAEMVAGDGPGAFPAP